MKSPTQHVVSVMFAALASVVVSAAPAMAQEAGGGGASAEVERAHGRGPRGPHAHGRHGRFSEEAMEHRLERLTERLALDEHQVVLVREIFAAARVEGRALRELPAGEARRAARQAFVEGIASRIDAVLSDAQRETFARLRVEHRERREARRAHRAGRATRAGI